MSLLKNKNVLITGASAGIGEACAFAFAKEGCNLIVIARRENRLKSLKQKIEKEFNVDVQIIVLDVSDKDEVFSQLKETVSVDILINNAGLALGTDKVHQANPDHHEIMINTNVNGLLNVTRAIVPRMVENGSGDIINISSIAGHEVYPGGAVYCATKHAVDALTKGLRMDLIDTPLRVSSISPGAVNTEFSTVRLNGDKATADKFYEGFDPLLGKDIAEIAIFNASRPAHVQIADVIVLANAQGAAKMIHKEK
ncbi:MAG: SDR family NAD(P)-dependent oxidoreductase [Calditrichaeota bacterium]|nr:MAG: SDR family NAD(P)-dependent oxidoreductase [Calditrichota bacterium]MBL1204299.1 SDR family NAD(P)-dependent oxidoreductase [Calditrichota bacterium]NOG44129.1 SDR family NAD(P)-dependent oxidoreductase [Calditrichota bacterium]